MECDRPASQVAEGDLLPRRVPDLEGEVTQLARYKRVSRASDGTGPYVKCPFPTWPVSTSGSSESLLIPTRFAHAGCGHSPPLREAARRSGPKTVLRLVSLFLASAAPVWLASQLLWEYDGGLKLWPLKNEIELVSVALVAATFTTWCIRKRMQLAPRLWAVPILLASAAFLLGGFKAANDFLDPPDLLLGILAQLVGFLYLLRVLPAGRKSPDPQLTSPELRTN